MTIREIRSFLDTINSHDEEVGFYVDGEEVNLASIVYKRSQKKSDNGILSDDEFIVFNLLTPKKIEKGGREWLKGIRLQHGLSQQNVADKLGITQQYYNLIENGERQKDLDLSIVLKLSELFEVTVDWIVEQEKETA